MARIADSSGKISEMGFTTMALAAFLPLLITLLACFAIALLLLYQRTAVDRICKMEVLKLQHELGRILHDLIRLNRSAEALRAQRAQAETALTMALQSGNPLTIAAAQAYRDAIIAKQIALSLQQKALLAQAGVARQVTNRNMQNHRGDFGIHRVFSRPDHAPTLAVRANPPDSLSPSYSPVNSFRGLQSQTYDYTLNVLERLPDWLTRFWKNSGAPTSMHASCSASLKNQDEKWMPILNAVNP